ncbi:hypothetical protein [Cellulomonas sp. Leaf334]|uniref:hypothetical protein n=1 Tax=Cellulomonas sp. Leaf334 TaxID=1736339 RepID=UPI0006FD3547|nr:hypothetical protein [Cellulomonas sp. Leaf334]KQR07704.1 hypothetical protein ASF78_20750 [Cellulomonas sp. Leaf334]
MNLALVVLSTILTVAAPGPQVTVDVTTLDAAAPTVVQVSGSGFQSVPGGFGGIYVLFGWVEDPAGGTWRPSAGGLTGEQLRYAPDVETAENAGHQRFVAFPGSSTSVEANGGEMTAEGTWATSLTVPGSTFTAVDRAGAEVVVDCLQVTCGVITIGAHGIENATNETFTPLTFAATEPTPTVSAPTPTATATPDPSPTGVAAPTAPAPAPVGPLAAGAAVLAAAGAGTAWVVRRRRSDDGTPPQT